jgi:hypothetical protein
MKLPEEDLLLWNCSPGATSAAPRGWDYGSPGPLGCRSPMRRSGTAMLEYFLRGIHLQRRRLDGHDMDADPGG